MKILGRREPITLLIGDLLVFVVSLWLALVIRSWSLPEKEFFLTHLAPFSILFVVWIMVFNIAGLYGKHTMIMKTKLPTVLLNTQLVNSGLAVLFFYSIDFFGITPKTILFIYLAISTLAILLWRRFIFSPLNRKNPVDAVLIGSGAEAEELKKEVNDNDIYGIHFVPHDKNASVVVADLSDEKIRSHLPDMYQLIFSGVNFLDLSKVYEEVFDRVPLSFLRYNWFIENISTHPRIAYTTLKRLMDIMLSIPILVLTGIFLPIVALAIKLEDGGPVFIKQERLGQGHQTIGVYKIRTMGRNDAASDKWGKESGNSVTNVGKFLRKTSIDELPQVWNILKGELSFIGPRSDIAGLGKRLSEEISYYNIRYLIKPGISGWAQVNQHYSPGNISPQSVEETKVRLSYDLYYVKNRSFALDLQIALRTLKTLISRLLSRS